MGKLLILLGLLSYSFIPTSLLKFKWRKGLRDSKKVILSFDDGPSEEYTRKLLDLLREHQIKASFFLVTDFVRENQEILDIMKADGHTIGVHSTNHKPLIYRGLNYTEDDLKRSIIEMECLGHKVEYYRPPWGQVNIWTLFLIRKYRLKIVLWSLMVQDWRSNTSVEYIEEKLLKNTRPGTIICLHDGRGRNQAPERTLEALRRVLPKLKEEYDFISLGEYYGEEVR